MGFTYNAAKTADEEKRKITLGYQDAEIVAQSVVETKSGDPMINLRWEFLDGDDAGKIIFDRVVVNEAAFFRFDQFVRALGYDPAVEFGDTPLDMAFVTTWAAVLQGMRASIKVVPGKPSPEYPNPGPQVGGYKPFGNAESAAKLLDLD